MTDTDVITVWVTRVHYSGGTLATGYGEVPGGSVEFVGEPRALWAISEALERGEGPVLAGVPAWAILRMTADAEPDGHHFG